MAHARQVPGVQLEHITHTLANAAWPYNWLCYYVVANILE